MKKEKLEKKVKKQEAKIQELEWQLQEYKSLAEMRLRMIDNLMKEG